VVVLLLAISRSQPAIVEIATVAAVTATRTQRIFMERSLRGMLCGATSSASIRHGLGSAAASAAGQSEPDGESSATGIAAR